MTNSGDRVPPNSTIGKSQSQMVPERQLLPSHSSSQILLNTLAAAGPQRIGLYMGFPQAMEVSYVQKPRRHVISGLERIKYRRTRSGCRTCRNRRVKCDEIHPTCDRCRKGNRICVYDEAANTKTIPQKPASNTAIPVANTEAKAKLSVSNNDNKERDGQPDEGHDNDSNNDNDNDNDDEYDDCFMYSTANVSYSHSLTEEATQSDYQFGSPNIYYLPLPETMWLSYNTPEFPGFGDGHTVQHLLHPSQLARLTPDTLPEPDTKDLSKDVRFYLAYFRRKINHFHYFFTCDKDDVFNALLPRIALYDDALLYSVVGFAAYHHALENPKGRVADFLGYYNKSVSILRKFLARNTTPSVTTLLTCLQLAAMEEYLGDWKHLSFHARGAHEFLLYLFNISTITQSPIGRAIQSWYTRFDLFISVMRNREPLLPLSWAKASVEFLESQVKANPASVDWIMDTCVAELQVLVSRVATLSAQEKNGTIRDDEFAAKHSSLSRDLIAWKNGWNFAITNPAHLARTDTVASGMDTVIPITIYDAPLLATNMLACQWHSVVLTHESRAAVSTSDYGAPALHGDALAICTYFRHIESLPSIPRELLIPLQPCISISALFISPDPEICQWIRQTCAMLEQMGCMFPLKLRQAIAEKSGDSSCETWWLPNNEGFTPLLREIHAAIRVAHEENKGTS